MKLNGKNILVISSNEWGAVFLSKHHYAVELARMGNNVYFLNPPNESLPERFRITKIVEHNLHVISYRSFPQSLRLRFHARFAYNIINKWYIKTILRKVNVKFDIAWCFDANLYDDLRMFGAPVIIYEPVDLVIYPYQLRIARHANIIVSISKSIIDAFREWPQPKLLVNHGLNPAFAADARKALAGLPESFVQPAKIRIGYVGNLVSPKFHRPYVRKMVTTYPQAEFHFWGPKSLAESNISGDDTLEIREFVAWLEQQPNVRLHGVKTGGALSAGIREMDIFLVLINFEGMNYYDGSNSHKLLEYMSTGKVIISNFFILQYEGSGLIEMPSREEKDNFMDRLAQVMEDIGQYNAPARQRQRLQYALENTYEQQISKIEERLLRL